MKKSHLIGALCTGVFSLISLTANAAFFGRLETSPGSGIYQAYYDDQLGITWTANANINGADNWDNQVAWAAGLNIDGVTGWRLPSMDVNGDDVFVDCPSQAACEDDEYSHLFFYGAGTVFGSGITPSRPGPFSNVQSSGYWSGTEFPSSPANNAMGFDFSVDGRLFGSKIVNFFAWAVHDGDVSTIDSDGDGLTDVDEIALGTDPSHPDTDRDTIPDGSDPDIIATAISALPLDPSAFANRGDPRGHRSAMLSRLTDIQSDIASGDIEQALRGLRNLRARVDGCGTSPDRNDWIIDCVAQLEIRRLIDLLITNLES